MTYALLLAYDGTIYGGWQIQKNTDTVQAHVEEACQKVFDKPVNVTASGRTDAGVHAAGQVCHLRVESTIPGERLADALNVHLPNDIRVIASAKVDDMFDANRTAKKKTYCYRFYTSYRENPLKARYMSFVKGSVDLAKLQYVASLLQGKHDFKAYCSAGSSVKTTERTVYQIDVKERYARHSYEYEVYVTGNGFLYNMVRTMVGTMIWYALGHLTEQDVMDSLLTGDRKKVGKTMPACGLTLEEVDYGFPIFK